ncbi:NifB/NifX family molybdenum-iron cluster-binding protein [Chromatium okenii]|uniref:NifB/NifX family molybdenum-iron cluster-binding protein n=1 Tax=Chromatium okenii TaxID=61644 RepID=UPI003D6B36E1
MAVASGGGGLVNQHFGEANEFLIYEASVRGVRLVGARTTGRYCHGSEQCEAGENRLHKTIRVLNGCEVVLVPKLVLNRGQLEAAGIMPNSEHALERIEDAVAAVYRELIAADYFKQSRIETQRLTA